MSSPQVTGVLLVTPFRQRGMFSAPPVRRRRFRSVITVRCGVWHHSQVRGVTSTRRKSIDPWGKHQLPRLSERWCVMKTRIIFYTSLLWKCPICSELWKIHEDMFSRRGDIRSGKQASCSQERCPCCGGVFVQLSANARQQKECVWCTFFA